MSLRPNDAPGQRSPTGDGDAGSAAGRWTLTRFVDGGVERPLGEARVTLCFGPDGVVTGESGVNDYRGSYAADADGGLRWLSPLHATRLGGPDALMKLELAYLSALPRAARWQTLPDGPGLRLVNSDGQTALTFRRQPDRMPATP